jgi:hypothetical protein
LGHFLDQNPEAALAWLTEQSDLLKERKETRIELLEWAILIFVILGVVVEGKWLWFALIKLF